MVVYKGKTKIILHFIFETYNTKVAHLKLKLMPQTCIPIISSNLRACLMMDTNICVASRIYCPVFTYMYMYQYVNFQLERYAGTCKECFTGELHNKNLHILSFLTVYFFSIYIPCVYHFGYNVIISHLALGVNYNPIL